MKNPPDNDNSGRTNRAATQSGRSVRASLHQYVPINEISHDNAVGTHGSCVRNKFSENPHDNAVGTHGSCVRNKFSENPHDNAVGTHGSCVQNKADAHPSRKSPRATFHDYSGGTYFVTICTQNKKHYFGKILNNEMQLNKIGEYCYKQISNLSTHYRYADVPLFVVMPNHIHAIICIGDWAHNAVGTHGSCVQNKIDAPCGVTVRTALSVVIGGLKRAVTMFARRNNIEFAWQSRYHDHIIRGAFDGNRISEYIENNVARWANDCFYK